MYKSSENIFRQNPQLVERVDCCVKKLVNAFKPQKVILFGSFARGEMKEGSTLDFMIIANTKLSFFNRIKKALLACTGGSPPIEPLIYTPEEIELLLNQGEGFMEDAMEEGIVLYKKD
jgi:predicted nucleotidyltransferase